MSVRVLVADDERAVRESLRRALILEGYEVELATGGREALASVGAGRADVVVLDVLMPDIDGLEVCRRLRHEGDRVPVLMLTARDAVSDRVEGLEAGADDYLVKPFSLLELEARLGALARRAVPRTTEGVLRVADLSYCPDTLIAEREGVAIKLNPSTRRLLVLLMQNTHRVVSRRELERELWGDQPPDGDVLRAHMYALRNAIDKPFARKLLHTHHGEGYRLALSD
ncbi:MAG TPA: response regulator transcription factor [Thermoleophilaceae bacterium]